MQDSSVDNSYWQAHNASSLLLEDLGNNTLCYNKESAETHFFNTFPAELLKLVITQPETSANLAKQLAALCDHPCDSDWQNNVDRVLLDLKQIQLIERVQP